MRVIIGLLSLLAKIRLSKSARFRQSKIFLPLAHAKIVRYEIDIKRVINRGVVYYDGNMFVDGHLFIQQMAVE